MELFNATGTAVTINSITGSVDGTFLIGALTLGVDYTIATNAFGRTIITLVTGGVFTTDQQIITINYDVTPEQADNFTHSQSAIATGFLCMIVWRGTDASTGQDMRYEIELEQVTNAKNFPALIGDSDESTAGIPCEFSGYIVKNGQRFVNFD